MNTFILDSNILNCDSVPAKAKEADIICFCPKRDDILSARCAYRQVLIDALRRDIPITAALSSGHSFDSSLTLNERDALCELLSYVSFLFADDDLLASIFGEEIFETTAEENIKRLYKRFGFCSVVLTDAAIAYDGEKITPFSEE
jgi:hypothetical protein